MNSWEVPPEVPRSGLCAQPGGQRGSDKELSILAERRLLIFQGEPLSDTSGWPYLKEEAAAFSTGLQAEGS